MSCKVIIVEDDLIIQMYITRLLSDAGAQVIGKATNFNQAITAIKQSAPDLILLDIGISGEKNGIDLANEINKEFQVPIVFITGNSDKSTVELASETNPLHIFNKPINEELFVRKMKKILESVS